MPSKVLKKVKNPPSNSNTQSHSKSRTLSTDDIMKELHRDQLKKNLVHYVALNLGSDKDFEQFCTSFVNSAVVPRSKKFEYIDATIALESYSTGRMSLLISHLVKTCKTVKRFTTYIHPLYMAHYAHFTEKAMGNFIYDLAETLLKRLKPEDFFNVLNLPSVDDKPLYKSFMKINFTWECYNPIIQTVRCFISKCNSAQLSSAVSIVNDFLDECVLNQKHYIVTYEKILATLNKILRMPEANAEDVFAVLEKCPPPRSAVTILPYINVCIQANDKKMSKDEVMKLLLPLFDPNNSSLDKLSEQKGLCWHRLIERELLPLSFNLSQENKDDLFKYIMEQLPEENRRETVRSILDHEPTPLNKYLWPQSKSFSLFSSSLPSSWVKKMKQCLALDAEAGRKLDSVSHA